MLLLLVKCWLLLLLCWLLTLEVRDWLLRVEILDLRPTSVADMLSLRQLDFL